MQPVHAAQRRLLPERRRLHLYDFGAVHGRQRHFPGRRNGLRSQPVPRGQRRVLLRLALLRHRCRAPAPAPAAPSSAAARSAPPSASPPRAAAATTTRAARPERAGHLRLPRRLLHQRACADTNDTDTVSVQDIFDFLSRLLRRVLNPSPTREPYRRRVPSGPRPLGEWGGALLVSDAAACTKLACKTSTGLPSGVAAPAAPSSPQQPQVRSSPGLGHSRQLARNLGCDLEHRHTARGTCSCSKCPDDLRLHDRSQPFSSQLPAPSTGVPTRLRPRIDPSSISANVRPNCITCQMLTIIERQCRRPSDTVGVSARVTRNNHAVVFHCCRPF